MLNCVPLLISSYGRRLEISSPPILPKIELAWFHHNTIALSLQMRQFALCTPKRSFVIILAKKIGDSSPSSTDLKIWWGSGKKGNICISSFIPPTIKNIYTEVCGWNLTSNSIRKILSLDFEEMASKFFSGPPVTTMQLHYQYKWQGLPTTHPMDVLWWFSIVNLQLEVSKYSLDSRWDWSKKQ